jgi:FtsH-binding integral membrane protein
MKDTKKEQLFMLIVATLFTGFMIYFVTDSGVASILGATFTGIVGVFIGLDIAVMIKKTSALPEGAYKEMNKQRYIAALVIFALLMIETFVISGMGRNCDSLYTSFGMGFLVVIGGLIAGIEGNKIVTGQSQKNEPPKAE